MRLLKVTTLELCEFQAKVPPYAIASHRWMDRDGQQHEVTYDDMIRNIGTSKSGYQKLGRFCQVVRHMVPHIEWLWIDTCCINKTNSTELSEAINSMFRWYKEADVCLAYLHDINIGRGFKHQVLLTSEWFTRGWTLQELLAPSYVVFLSQGWQVLGHKSGYSPYQSRLNDATQTAYGAPTPASFGESLNDMIANATRIPIKVLGDVSEAEALSFEERQQWMRFRQTTRPEDMAYCQLGLYGVFLPPIYGEREQAFERLREAFDNKTRRKGLPVPCLTSLPIPRSRSINTTGPTYVPGSSQNQAVYVTSADDANTDAQTDDLFDGYSPSLPKCDYLECQYKGINKFDSRQNMWDHMREVHGKKSYDWRFHDRSCDLDHGKLFDCGYSGCHRKGTQGFSRKDKMRDHMREIHRISMPKRAEREETAEWPMSTDISR